ncbi:MAG: hypothetical protein EPO26_04585 [Chloroflexota bacterium]|nr:MAG: hypothetical protein EPO26_04585 [Chloroflexota bacterium]
MTRFAAMLRLLLVVCVLLGTLVTPASVDAAVAGKVFSETGGYSVTNDNDVRFWESFRDLGGEQIVGYPVSRRFDHGGFVTQVMQKAVFQWRPESGQVYFVNVFDDLSVAGKNDWLYSVRSTPRPLDPSFDDGKDWDGVVRARVGLLDERPRMRARYRSVADPLKQFGLPTSRVEDMGNHYAIRLQRAVIQEWKVDVPWARAGETTVANGGDILKEAGLVPQAASAPGTDTPRAAPVAPPGTVVRGDGRVVSDMATIRTSPSDDAPIVARLFRNAQVAIDGPESDGWVAARVWGTLHGWVRTSAITTESYPSSDTRRGTGYRPAIPARPVASTPLTIDVAAAMARDEDMRDAPGGRVIGRVSAGQAVRANAYGGSAADIWVRISGASSGWVPALALRVAARDPLAPRSDGSPISRPVRGKGMWATYDLLDRASPQAIVEAARASGITHIYLQVGRSNLGFYGGPGLDGLLPVAHANGISIIAWVYPYLKDITADLNLTAQAARYVTPDGHRPDGLASDVEENMEAEAVHAYSQMTRALLGDDTLLVIATYPPRMYHGQRYPFAAVAQVWNVIAPMDYYHRAGQSYSAAAAREYIANSVAIIRQRAGRSVEIAPIGQAYGMSWPNEVGPTNPSGHETVGMIEAAKAAGSVGISFFEWSHATEQQWRAITATGW